MTPLYWQLWQNKPIILLLATGRGVSTSVLVSHVDSVSLVQLSWYLGSIMASARLPPHPIGKTIQGRCSSCGRQGMTSGSIRVTAPSSSTPAASLFPCPLHRSTGCKRRLCASPKGAELHPINQSAAAILSVVMLYLVVLSPLLFWVYNKSGHVLVNWDMAKYS